MAILKECNKDKAEALVITTCTKIGVRLTSAPTINGGLKSFGFQISININFFIFCNHTTTRSKMRSMSNPWPTPDAALPTRYEYLRSQELSRTILPNSPQMRMKRDREETLRKCKYSTAPKNHAVTVGDDLNSTSPVFQRFAEFPQELKVIIWTLALPPGRTITPRIRMSLLNREPNLVNIACNMDIIPRSHLDAIATPLMHTCKSSRKIALKHYQVAINPFYSSVGSCPNFYIDFVTDVLHMDWMVARAILKKLGGPDDLYEPIMKNLRFLSCFQHVATSAMFTLDIVSLAKMEKLGKCTAICVL